MSAEVVYREVGVGSYAWCVERKGERIATFPLGANAERNAGIVADALNAAERLAEAEAANRRLMDDVGGVAAAAGAALSQVKGPGEGSSEDGTLIMGKSKRNKGVLKRIEARFQALGCASGDSGVMVTLDEFRALQQQLEAMENESFDRGVLAALACVDGHGEVVIYQEIVSANGGGGRLWRSATAYDREHLRRHGYAPARGRVQSGGGRG